MPQFTVNKWVQGAMSLVIVATSISASIQWDKFLDPKTAASVAAFFGGVKLLTNIFAPSANVTPQPTGGTIITHTAQS